MAANASGIPPKDVSDDEFQLKHHRLLDIPEMLISIFSSCSPSTNAALTCVCRTWSDLASDQLWSDLPSLLPLLRILLPLVLVDDALDFDLKARAPNWERFWALASRVRQLEHDDGSRGDTTESPTEPSGRISPNVIPFLLLRQSWTSKRFLLPNLETLKWSIWWEDSFLQLSHFLSPSLRNLVIYIEDSVPVDPVTRNLERLALLPSMYLERLNIGTNYPMDGLDEQVALVVASFVKSQPTLSILDLSQLWSRGEVVRGLVQHEGLQSLELNLCPGTPLELRSLLDLLAHQCPRISTFTFNLYSTFPELTPHHAIEPLLSCRLLRRLEIFHRGGLSVSSHDIKNMAQAWRNMEVLSLCACATDTIRLGTPLALLLDFAEEFNPRLRRLALHFLCDGELPTADVVRATFPKLEVLGVGPANAASTARARAIGDFLASVVSEETRLAYMPDNWVGNDPFDTTNWKRSPRASHWVEVAAILESAQRLQKVAPEKSLKADGFQRF